MRKKTRRKKTSRLIDADSIDFKDVFIGASDFAKDARDAAKQCVDAQPTAYDPERIAEQVVEYLQTVPNPDDRDSVVRDIICGAISDYREVI